MGEETFKTGGRDMECLQMNQGQMLSSAIMFGVLIVVSASQAEAQSSTRRAAIERCTAQAQSRWPDANNRNTQHNRTMTYKACMHSAGLRP